jgi:hypothetical protein
MLRKPNSIPSNDVTIKDPVMDPFFISRSQTGGYTVFENVIKGENNTEYIKTVCYPSNFQNALKAVARELLNYSTSKEKTEYNLKQYVSKWEEVQEKISSIFEE